MKERKIIENILWMAIRYAHGRHTYAPSMVREAVADIKKLYPDFRLRKDVTIEPPKKEDIGGMKFRDDYLDDLFTDDLEQTENL
jgi:hypothetical protein